MGVVGWEGFVLRFFTWLLGPWDRSQLGLSMIP